MSKRVVHTEVIEAANETIVLEWGPFEWFAENCKYRHYHGTDIPFADCSYKKPAGTIGDCCYRFCKRYKRKRRKLDHEG